MSKIRNTAQLLKDGCFLLEYAARAYPSEPALISGGVIVDYSAYLRLVNKTADVLKGKGVHNEYKLAVLSNPSIEYTVLLMAILRSGIVAVPVSTRLPREAVITHLVSINCDTLIVSKEFSNIKTKSAVAAHPIEEFVSAYKELDGSDKARCNSKVIPVQLPFERDATIFFTSGSSGMPKAVLHMYANHIYSALGANENILFEPGDRWLLSLPLYHIGGFAVLIRAALGGGAVVITSQKMNLASALEEYAATHVSLVSTQLCRLLENEKAVEILKKMKAIVLGGGFFSPSLIKKALEYNLPIVTSYGSTETASQVTATGVYEKSDKYFTAGRPLPYREVSVSPDGEILVRGKTLCKGYVKDSTVVSPSDKDGWFHTGDLGYFDSDGYLIVTGRKDLMFISGGENIYPEAIESVLNEYPGIKNAIVIPVPDEEFSARPAAFVQLETDKPLNSESISAFLSKRIPSFMIPDFFWRMPEELCRQSVLKYDRTYFIRLAREYLSNLHLQ